MPAKLLGKTPLVTDLQRADAYPPPPPTRVDLVTTHISWVFLTDHDVWKVKRPVAYGFVDYTTLEQRRHFCDEEVRLNRRLAPGVYLGVVPVRLGPAGHTLTGDGPIVDYAVHMRRLPDAASAEALLRSGALTHDHLWLIAATLGRFYATSPATPRYGAPDAIETNVAENFEQVRPFVGRLLPAATFGAVQDWQVGFLGGHADRFKARIDQDRIRDGHGDLRLEHVYLEGTTPLVLDCIEFNERFRMGDVASDAGFLAMELDARARGARAEVALPPNAGLAGQEVGQEVGIGQLFLRGRLQPLSRTVAASTRPRCSSACRACAAAIIGRLRRAGRTAQARAPRR